MGNAADVRREALEHEQYLFAISEARDDGYRTRCLAESAHLTGEFVDHTLAHRPYAALIPDALRIEAEAALELATYTGRAIVRHALADKIERDVFPTFRPRWLDSVPLRLRVARLSGAVGVSTLTGKLVRHWDDKAGLARLCPDDAREEAMRLRRRVQPALERLATDGERLTYAVFTLPNAAPGKLRATMEAIFKRFRSLMRARDGEGGRLFPQITGALAVLEAPLGRMRDWNVHLNVIFSTRGFLDWKRLRARWHWNVDLQRLEGDRDSIGAALTELIKYAVAATVAKSQAHAEAGATPAPPMLEWTGAELAEWLAAMHAFRRTRTYGSLYRLERPVPEALGEIIWLARCWWDGARYRQRIPLLDSIPEDKSTQLGDRKLAWERFYRLITEPDRDPQAAPVPFSTLVRLYGGPALRLLHCDSHAEHDPGCAWCRARFAYHVKRFRADAEARLAELGRAVQAWGVTPV